MVNIAYGLFQTLHDTYHTAYSGRGRNEMEETHKKSLLTSASITSASAIADAVGVVVLP